MEGGFSEGVWRASGAAQQPRVGLQLHPRNSDHPPRIKSSDHLCQPAGASVAVEVDDVLVASVLCVGEGLAHVGEEGGELSEQ